MVSSGYFIHNKQKGVRIMNRKKSLPIALLLMAIIAVAACSKKDGAGGSAFMQKYDSESDFEARPIDGGKSVMVTNNI
jgi:hypothetical protein